MLRNQAAHWKCHNMREHKVKRVIWEVFTLSDFMKTIVRYLPMSSCKPCKPCTPHREMAAWWRAPIIRARIGTGLLFAIHSTRAQVLYLEHLFLMIYWRGWGQMQQCHPLTGRTATHAGANENRWAVCAYSNNKCCGSKSFRIAPYIFSRAAFYFLTSKTSLVMLIFFLLFQMC